MPESSQENYAHYLAFSSQNKISRWHLICNIEHARDIMLLYQKFYLLMPLLDCTKNNWASSNNVKGVSSQFLLVNHCNHSSIIVFLVVEHSWVTPLWETKIPQP